MSGRPTITYNGKMYFVADIQGDAVRLEDPATGLTLVVNRSELPAGLENIGKGVSGVQSEPIPIRQDPAVPIRPVDPKGREPFDPEGKNQ